MISVCIATYNGAEYIKEELDSILPQLAEYDEIIISDDGSIDDTINIIESYKDKRIKIHFHKKRTAKFRFDFTTHNFENAIEKAKGDYIFLADQDDIWYPNKVEKMLNALEKNEIAISDSRVVDKNLNIILESRYLTNKPSCKILKNLITARNPGCCIAFRKSILKSIIPFPEYGVSHDFWIAVRGAVSHKVGFIPEPLIYFRRHDHNVSTSMGKSHDSLAYRLKYRYLRIIALLQCVGIKKLLSNLL